MTTPVVQDWLSRYIAESVAKNLCTNPTCTTCGAQEFRSGLRRALSDAMGVEQPGDGLTSETAVRLSEAAALVCPTSDQEWTEAVRLILFDIWYTLGPARAERDLRTILGASWAGDLLSQMQEHYRREIESRRRHEERSDPEKAKVRREEKKRSRQIRHSERLAAKRERDRRRRASTIGLSQQRLELPSRHETRNQSSRLLSALAGSSP